MKLSELRDYLAKKGIDRALLLSAQHNDLNITYLSRAETEGGALVISEQRMDLLLSQLMQKPRTEARITSFSSRKEYRSVLRKLLGRAKKIGINGAGLSVNELKALQKLHKGRYVDISEELLMLRMTKTDEELQRITWAASLSSQILEECIKKLGSFRTEEDARDFLAQRTREAGCTQAFPAIVASGRNSAVPHYDGNSRIMQGFMVIDFGVKYKGYCADMTRTVYVGKPSIAEQELYSLVLSTQEGLLKEARAGREVSMLERYVIKKLARYKRNILHSIGHGIGIEVHEPIREKLQKGMTIALEPGIYFKNRYGIRIEDTVLVASSGCRQLTRASKELCAIPAR